MMKIFASPSRYIQGEKALFEMQKLLLIWVLILSF